MEAQYKLLGAYGSQLNTAITRYDMAQMMYNILWDYGATLPEVAEKNVARRSIKDWDSIPSAYQEAVVTCYGLGLLSGYPDGTFGGQNRMNRAQGCVVILKLLDFVS